VPIQTPRRGRPRPPRGRPSTRSLRVDTERHLWEIHELRRQAALANDVVTLVPLKEADRALKRAFGRGDDDPGDSYADLKERIAEDLFTAANSEERAVKARKDSLRAAVRQTVENELADEWAELDATAAALEDREQAVAEPRAASPSLLPWTLRSRRRASSGLW
jgi:hypothetical protein